MIDNKKVMVVDDSRVSRMMIKAQLLAKHPHWQIYEATDGQDALEKMSDLVVDYFTIDLNMPGIDGLTLIEQLKPQHSESLYVLLTANIQQATHDKAQKLAVKCVNKPITEQCISSILEYFNV
ncbi:response regulator transcription factor [Pseudoalteromonas ulvae]|uniref:response regulator transcription factor n=1 Tax=Pseudoalteromonas ulvae TaxID=107327 RepID=UPI001C3C2001|nr:response regulator [Pseudoalteromonas ulvae]